jgi:hypothetical protein
MVAHSLIWADRPFISVFTDALEAPVAKLGETHCASVSDAQFGGVGLASISHHLQQLLLGNPAHCASLRCATVGGVGDGRDVPSGKATALPLLCCSAMDALIDLAMVPTRLVQAQ